MFSKKKQRDFSCSDWFPRCFQQLSLSRLKLGLVDTDCWSRQQGSNHACPSGCTGAGNCNQGWSWDWTQCSMGCSCPSSILTAFPKSFSQIRYCIFVLEFKNKYIEVGRLEWSHTGRTGTQIHLIKTLTLHLAHKCSAHSIKMLIFIGKSNL